MKPYITPSVDIVYIDATIMSDWGSLSTGETPNNQQEMGGVGSENGGTDYYDAVSYRATLWESN